MRQPSDFDRNHRPEDPPSVARSITLTLLLVGVVLAVSFPQVTAAVLLGALTATVYHRLRRRRGRSPAQDRTTRDRAAEDDRQASETAPVRTSRVRNGSD